MSKPRVLVIGGKRKNIPAWAEAAFEITLLDQDGSKSRIDPSDVPPAAIVIYTGAVSHQHSGQAHEMGATWDIPVLKARDGWSTAVEQAAQIGADWFVNAVQTGAQALDTKNPPRSKEGLEVVDNAWRDLAEQEVAKSEAMAKRLRKVQTKLDKANEVISRLRSGAEARIVAEIRARAAMVRQERDALDTERKIVHGIVRNVASWLEQLAPVGDLIAHLEEVEKRLQGRVD